MRVVKCCIMVLVVAMPHESGVLAQNAAPAGLLRQTTSSTWRQPASDSTRTSLRVHMERGGIIGGIAGLGLSGLVLMAIASTPCPVFATSAPGFEGDCSGNLSSSKTTKIVLGGALVGAAIGSVLGYTYHVNADEERARRCRANPASCP